MSKKICLLTDSLSSGGAEKMVANLSKSLTEKRYEVTLVSMQDVIVYEFKGVLYNFGKFKNSANIFKSFSAFRNFIKTQQFDVILDHRIRNKWFKEFVFSKFVFNKHRVVYCVHHYDLDMYFPLVSIPFLSKQTLVKQKEIVAVSDLVHKEIKKRLNLESKVIYNYPETSVYKNEITPKFQYIIAVGRLEKIKQFDVLIKCYKASRLKEKDVKLLIFGDGSQLKNLQGLIDSLNLENHVFLKGFSTNVSSFIAKAKALIMTSQSEGFPMVLIEAIQQKTPVISFDCKSGPSEIIKHNINGLLVKNQDEIEMTKALDTLTNDIFYLELKEKLMNYNSPFTEERIVNQWLDLLEQQI